MYGRGGSRCGGWAGGSTPGDDGQTQTSPPSAQQLSRPVGLLATRTINLSPEACARATDVGIFGIFCASRYRSLPLLISDTRSQTEAGGVDAVSTELMLARPGGRGVARDAAPVSARGSTTILDRGAVLPEVPRLRAGRRVKRRPAVRRLQLRREGPESEPATAYLTPKVLRGRV